MEMLLMGLCLSVFGMAVAAAAFGAATRSESWDSAVQPELPLVKASRRPAFSRTVLLYRRLFPPLAGAH